MAYQVTIQPSAMRELKKLDKPVLRRIWPAIRALADEPRPHGVEKLQGADDLHRIRVGDFRIIYQISDKHLTVAVVKVGDRKDIYR